MGEALYDALLSRIPGGRLPRLCAGRRPSRSARLSGAPASGERRQFVLRLGRRRSRRADRRHPAPSAKLDRRQPQRGAPSATFRCRAIFTARPARIPPASNSATRPASRRCCRSPRRRTADALAAPLDRRNSLPGRERRYLRRSTARRSARSARATRRRRRRPMAAAAAGFAAWARRRSRGARAAIERAADLLEQDRGRCRVCCRSKAARPSTTRSPSCARRSDYCRYYAAEARRAVRRADRCPGRPARATSCAIAAAACSSASALGTSRWRSFIGQVDGGACRRQYRRRQAGRTDSADRRISR